MFYLQSTCNDLDFHLEVQRSVLDERSMFLQEYLGLHFDRHLYSLALVHSFEHDY